VAFCKEVSILLPPAVIRAFFNNSSTILFPGLHYKISPTFKAVKNNFLGNGMGIQFSPLHWLNPNGNSPNAYVVVYIMDTNGNENISCTSSEQLDQLF
jgi:hypothetical protein